MKTVTCPALVLALASIGFAGELAPPRRVKFSVKPAATRTNGKVKITFTASAPTDVAVFIEDARGEVIRHLVAGALGPKAPAPLKPGLAQSIEWDGRADYGRPATGGPFKVRVALGLGAKYDRVVSSKPVNLETVSMLGVGPDGTLYVRNVSSPAVWTHTQLIALDRDGKYLRTLVPFPSTLGLDRVKGYGAMELDGRPAPGSLKTGRKMDFLDSFSGSHGPSYATMAVSTDGKDLYMLLGRRRPYMQPGIVRIASDGSCPDGKLSELLKPGGKLGVASRQPAAAVVSSDGKLLFFAGVATDRNGNKTLPAVYKVPIPARKGMSVFFGDAKKKGAGRTLLGGAPTGLALDGKGNLLVADPANHRVVVVAEKDGKYVGELKVGKFNCLGASRKTGAVYVTVSGKGRARLLKFDSAKAAKPSAELALPGFRHIMTVDPGATPPVIWFGTRVGVLLRIEDRSGKLAAKTVSPGTKARKGTQEGYVGLVVDRHRKEIYARNGHNGGLWQRFIEKTGKTEIVLTPEGSGGGGKGLQLSPSPDGNLYGLKWPYQFYKFGRDGKPLAWAKPKRPDSDDTYDPTKRKGVCPRLRPHIGCIPVAMGELPHTLGVRWSDGKFLIQEATVPRPGAGARTTKSLHEYDLSGQRVTKLDAPIIWKMTDAALGPKLDAAGNIYVAEIVRPKGWVCPPELVKSMTAGGAKAKDVERAYGAMYGSIVKFPPKGGMFHVGTGRAADGGPDPFKGKPKLNGLKSAEYDYFYRTLRPMKVTGAEWVHPGIGHVGLYGCNCENVTFDVDEFGRVFFPDLSLYRVRVIDTAGNAITHFGSYGNPDQVTREKRTLFAWLVGVGATDKYVYTGDAVNRQMLRAKITYAAEETCNIK
jgi:hypothetical protein